MIVFTENCMSASSKSFHCFSSLSRKLDEGRPIIEEFQSWWQSCVNNVQHCLCDLCTQLRHSRQTATQLYFFWYFEALILEQQACMWVTFWGIKGHRCSSGYVLNELNGKQLMQEWGVRNNDYLEEPNCSTNGRPGSIISYTYKTKLKIKSCISPCEWWEIYHWVYRVPSLKSRTALFPSSVKVTIASEDISPRTLSLSATKHSSWVSTVLHLVVCCVGWVHSSISSESSQVAETCCWLEKSIFASSLSLAHCVLETTELWQMLPILECLGTVHWLNSLLCIIIVPGTLCTGDNRTVANASHSWMPGYSSLVEFFVVRDHLRDGILDVDQALKTDKGTALSYNSWEVTERLFYWEFTIRYVHTNGQIDAKGHSSISVHWNTVYLLCLQIKRAFLVLVICT